MTVKLNVPTSNDVPESTPPLVRVSPVGRLPLVTAKLCGETPPVTVMVWLYAAPAIGFGSVAGLTTMVGAGTFNV